MSFDQGYWCTPEHVITAAIGLTILDITFVTLRFVARKKQRQPLKVDDWIIIPATVCMHHPDLAPKNPYLTPRLAFHSRDLYLYGLWRFAESHRVSLRDTP